MENIEEIGLIVEFVEQKVRGSEEVTCIVKVKEIGDGDEFMDEFVFDSWEKMTEKYPTFKSLLKEIFLSENWRADWCDGQRLIYAESVEGHQGLYKNVSAKVKWSEV